MSECECEHCVAKIHVRDILKTVEKYSDAMTEFVGDCFCERECECALGDDCDDCDDRESCDNCRLMDILGDLKEFVADKQIRMRSKHGR